MNQAKNVYVDIVLLKHRKFYALAFIYAFDFSMNTFRLVFMFFTKPSRSKPTLTLADITDESLRELVPQHREELQQAPRDVIRLRPSYTLDHRSVSTCCDLVPCSMCKTLQNLYPCIHCMYNDLKMLFEALRKVSRMLPYENFRNVAIWK